MTHCVTFRVLALFVCGATLALSGCMTERASNNLGYAVTENVFGSLMDIPFWTEAFRRHYRRLPKDYSELCQFVLRQTDSRVQLEPYSRVDFAILPSGQRQAECYSVSSGVTNKCVVAWGKRE